MKNFNIFQIINIWTRSEITEPKLKIFELEPIYKNTRTVLDPYIEILKN